MANSGMCSTGERSAHERSGILPLLVSGHVKAMKVLLRAGAQVDAMDKRTFTPLIIAAQTSNIAATSALVQCDFAPNSPPALLLLFGLNAASAFMF